MLQGLLQVCNHEDTIAMFLFNLGLEATLLDSDEVVVQDAGAEDDLYVCEEFCMSLFMASDTIPDQPKY